MKNKGFTLIELLAVIVILAIIALIAIPMISKIIDKTEDSAVIRSAELYIDGVNQSIMRANLKDKIRPKECEIQEDGNLICDGEYEIKVETTGTKPSAGILVIEDRSVKSFTGMILDEYELKKEDREKIVITSFNEIQRVNYLMKSDSSKDAPNVFLGGKIERSNVESITTVSSRDVPKNAIASWDVSEKQNKSIMAWYTDINNNGLYELYIGQKDGVKANPDSSLLFYKFSNITEIDLSNFDTGNVTNMTSMFHACNNLTSIDLSNFNTSKVTNMKSIFQACRGLTNIDVSSFDTSNVTNMYGMFSACDSLTEVDLSTFNTSKVTNMERMFDMSKNLVSINLNGFDTSNVTNMVCMFQCCNSLKNLNVSSFNTSRVTNMEAMFYECTSFTSLDISNFDTSNVTNMQSMFGYCTGLTNLNLSSFVITNLKESYYMFSNCTSLATLDLRNADFTNVKSSYDMFTKDSKLKTIYVKDSVAQSWIKSRMSDSGYTVTPTIV